MNQQIINIKNNTWNIAGNGIGAFRGNAQLSENLWQHWVVQISPGENGTKVFLNGNFQKSGSLNLNAKVTSTPFYIGQLGGRVPVGGRGALDDVRIYNRALSEAEVSELYELEKPVSPLEQGLVAYYPFNGNAKDESGNGNDLETISGDLGFDNDRFGQSNSTVSINKTKLSPINLNGFPKGKDNFTFSTWVNIDDRNPKVSAVIFANSKIKSSLKLIFLR